MKKYLIISISIMLLFSISSCNKKWKQTTNVDFHFQIAKATSGANFAFTSGTMLINEFDFSGDRVKGGGVNFSNPMTNGNTLNFDNGYGNPPIYYDIPQGTYSRMTIALNSVHQGSNGKNIYLKGTYHDTIDVIFNFNESAIYYSNVTTQSGNSEITLVEGTPATCDVTFDPSEWFATVPTSLFISSCGSSHSITISAEDHELIYDIVKTRITKYTTAVIQ
jgi:hypothetical protein